MQAHNYVFTDSDLQVVFDYMDHDRKGGISYQEFTKAFKGAGKMGTAAIPLKGCPNEDWKRMQSNLTTARRKEVKQIFMDKVLQTQQIEATQLGHFLFHVFR